MGSLRADDGTFEEVQVNEVNVVQNDNAEFEFDNDLEYDSEDNQRDTLLDDNEEDINNENQSNADDNGYDNV
ncbi:hypothetical protein PIB30_035752 [Stylosanthes scabra]|uniref:Uncharacterized protein n=1 Tax=Stylosanthes scabra TaxID=79078 RepID=A0ABU6RE01_9FABA|nr:hypothetical protein [Stylosanthes scabra]